MRVILFIMQKEFIQVFRNRMMLPILFVIPIIQLLILVNAATYEMKNIRIAFVDYDHSTFSQRFITKIRGTDYFIVGDNQSSVNTAIKAIDENKVTAVVVIPKDFEKKLKSNAYPLKIQVLINAINSVNATISYSYVQQIFLSLKNEDVFVKHTGNMPVQTINTIPRYWYNADFNYKKYMVPGVLVMLVTLISFLLAALNIVREKEVGTIEQLNVTPIKKYQFIIGKLLPFWILALFELALGLTIGKLVYDIPLAGSLPLLFAFSGVYMIVLLSMGLFVSTLVDNQQQATLVSFFFLMGFILLSGLFISLESMPPWIQYINKINPLAYYVSVMRMILLKGSGFIDILPHFISISILAMAAMALAVFRYRKTSG